MDKELKLADKNFEGWESRLGLRAEPSTMTEDNGKFSVDAIITTEKTCEVIDWEKWEIVDEMLLMEGCVMPETKQIPLLDSHSRYDLSTLKGSIRDLRIETDKLVGKVYFASDAEREIKLVKDGHLTDLSVGYKISKDETVEIQPDQELTFTVNGKTKTVKNDNPKKRLLVRTKWYAKEGSLVAIGADDASKFRSELQSLPKIKAEDSNLESKINEIVEKKISQIKTNEKGTKMLPELTSEQRAEVDGLVAVEVERINSIKGVAELYGKQYKHGDSKLNEAVDAAIKEKHSVEKFKSHLLDNFDSSKAIATPGVDLSEKEKKEYSLSAGIMDMAEGRFGKTKSSGLVKEINDHLCKEFPDSLKTGTSSFLVPNEYFGARELFKGKSVLDLMGGARMGVDEAKLLMRAMDATTGPGSGGINLVGSDFRPDLFIEILRSKLALGAAGVTILTGLKENITIPRQLTDATYGLAAEGIAGAESSLTFDQITSSPNIGTGWVEFTKQLLIQGNPSIDALVRESLLAVQLRGQDYLGLVGGGGITGLLNESGTYPVTIAGGDPDWTDIVTFETGIENADAMIGETKWLMSPTIKGRAKTTPKISGSQISGWLMETNGDMNGYASVISTILNRTPMNGYYLILGVWKQMMLNIWGATEIQVNPYSKDTQGIIRVVLMNYFDWIVRQPAAFAISDDVTES